MAEFPSLPLFTDAYLADTAHLSCLESGAYLHLLFAAWRTETCSLPADETKLARMAKCSPREWKRVREAVLAFWDYSEETNSLTQDRLLREQERCREYSARQANAANAKWRERKKTRCATASSRHMPDTIPKGMPNASQTDAPSPSPISFKERGKIDLSGVIAETAKALKGGRQGIQVDWGDKANWKARWQQKIETEIRASFTEAEAATIIAGAASGDAMSKKIYDMVDAKMKQRKDAIG